MNDFKELINPTVTVNSVSGGKTSAYIAANYPADYNIFALVTTTDKNCMFPDKKLRQVVSDKIGKEFIGTLEEDVIIHTILDLEQYIGKEIIWVNDQSFDEHNTRNKLDGTTVYIVPSVIRRSCTFEMKIIPMANWLYENVGETVEVRIGFRANETRRANNMIERTDENGILPQKFIIGKHKNGNNKWKEYAYQKPRFPLIEDNIYKDKIEMYWQDKPVRFAYMNNCIGCFHRSPALLKHMSVMHPKKYQWFVDAENKAIASFNDKMGWKKGYSYEGIRQMLKQMELFDEDFNECDSGYCGL
jgi:hypothetical protein